jgi:hypothetical protein
MNKLAIAALLGSASAIDTTQFVEGLLKGAVEEQHFDNIEKCLVDAEEIGADAEIAIKDFEKGTTQGVMDGLAEMAKVLMLVKKDISTCESISADVKKLVEEAAAFSNPEAAIIHLGKDIIINGRNIYKEVNTAVADYHNEKWEDMGYQLGEASAQLILGDSREKLASIYQGFFDAFGVKIDVYALLICIGEEDKALLVIDAGVQMVKEALANKDY